MPFLKFFFLLREYGILVSVQQVLDFYKGLEKGLARNLDDLFTFARLVFVKRVEHVDDYERAFALYFYNLDLPKVVEGDPELLATRQFREWLEQAIKNGELPERAVWSMSREDLMKKFWDTVRKQMEAHQGGSKWVGTGGNSPFGHSGNAERGIRVHGSSGRRSAIKVIGDRRFISYNQGNDLKGENIRQVLTDLRRMLPVGAEDELDLGETIHRTCQNGGDIDLAFKRQELDRIKLVLLIDNGGTSMWPFVKISRLLFSKVKNRFQDSLTYYFHNTIYGKVYKDERRMEGMPLKELLRMNPETRVFIVGDASMAPEELVASHGNINYGDEDSIASIDRLKSIRDRFPFTVWLNPIHKSDWHHSYGSWTIKLISDIFEMEDLTLRGVKSAVSFLRNKAQK